jgi:hypothetical protein
MVQNLMARSNTKASVRNVLHKIKVNLLLLSETNIPRYRIDTAIQKEKI